MKILRRPGARTGSAVSRFTNLVFFIAVLVITAGVVFFLQGARAHKVLILDVTNSRTGKEEIKAARLLLDRTYGFKATGAGPEEMVSLSSLPEEYDVIWIHKTDTNVLDEKVKEMLVPVLKDYLAAGGNILLTDEAFPLIHDLGLESRPPQLHRLKVESNGFTRVEGFHSFQGHPIFKGFFGGAFVFQPLRDTVIRAWGYFDDVLPQNGRVAAIRWQDIFFHETDKTILEYRTGKGRLIAVGSSLYLCRANDLRGHLQKFITNLFEYFVNPPKKGEAVSWWSYSPLQVVRDTLHFENIPVAEPGPWSPAQPLLQMTGRPEADDEWDLAGERMLMTGREKGGLEEVWIHPFMALRDYEAGVVLPGDTTVRWLQDAVSSAEIRAAALVRRYTLRGGMLKEIVTVHPHRAAGVIHYEWDGKRPVELVFRFRSNLRWMWPYSQKATGGIRYAWSDALQAFTFRDVYDGAMVLVGMNRKPEEVVTGPYERINISGGRLVPVRGERFQAGAAARIRLPRAGSVDVTVAGAWEDRGRAVDLHRRVMAGTQRVLRDQEAFVRAFLGHAAGIESPDSAWSRAYRWSLLNTRRFMVATPGVGTALAAGYATTARGWDGAQPVSGRPGYAWYFGRDGQWSAMAMLDYGDFEQVRKVLAMYMRYQDSSGEIFHELTTSGVAHYSSADATPLFVVLAGRYLRQSGDIDFIGRHRESIRRAMDFCYHTDFNHDGLIENMRVGHGWVEGGSLYGSRTTLYLASVWAEALKEAAAIFNTLGEENTARRYAAGYRKAIAMINDNFWNDSTRFFNHGLYPDGSYNPQPTIMPAIPLLFGQITLSEKTNPVLEQFSGDGFSSDWGTRIIPEDAGNFNPGSYHGGSVWPLYTGWAALAEYRNGFPVQGYIHMAENMRIGDFWAKGAIEEVMHGESYRPYGVCWHQCWSEIMVHMPALEGMLGWQPDALKHAVTLKPAFPAHWDTVAVTGLRCGDNTLDMTMKRNDPVTVFVFSLKGKEMLKIRLHYIIPAGETVEKILVTGKEGKYILRPGEREAEISFGLKREARVTIRHYGGIALVPPVPAPLPGDGSHGFRVTGEAYGNGVWTLRMEGRPGSIDTMGIRTRMPVTAVAGASPVRPQGNIQRSRVIFPQSKEKYVVKKVVFCVDTTALLSPPA